MVCDLLLTWQLICDAVAHCSSIVVIWGTVDATLSIAWAGHLHSMSNMEIPILYNCSDSEHESRRDYSTTQTKFGADGQSCTYRLCRHHPLHPETLCSDLAVPLLASKRPSGTGHLARGSLNTCHCKRHRSTINCNSDTKDRQT